MHSITQRMKTLASCCRWATSVNLPPETPFSFRAVWPLRRQAASDDPGLQTESPGLGGCSLAGCGGNTMVASGNVESRFLLRERRHPELWSSPCGERPSLLGLLFDPFENFRRFQRLRGLYITPHRNYRTSVDSGRIIRQDYFNTVTEPSTPYPPSLTSLDFYHWNFFDAFFNHVIPPPVYLFSFPVAKYIRYKFWGEMQSLQ